MRKIVDNPVYNLEYNCINKMFINLKVELEPNHWAIRFSEMLTQAPFYNGEKVEQIQHIIQYLCQQIEQGDSCIQLDSPPHFLQELCDFKVDNTAILAKDLSTATQLPQTAPLLWQAPYLYLYRYWRLEQDLAQAVRRLLQQKVEQIAESEFNDILKDEHQKQALAIAVNQPFAMITGGPGTGKTYVLTRIVGVLKKYHPKIRIAMAAPTGKAAQRMHEALQLAFNDDSFKEQHLDHDDFKYQTTQTLHRLLGLGTQHTPRYHAEHPLPYDVVVVDEASMLDLNLAKMLFDAIGSHTRLILLGDAQQLSSVDVGHVLADLQAVPVLKSYQVNLQTSRRFFANAHIGRLAKAIYADKKEYQNEDISTWLQQLGAENLQHIQQFDNAKISLVQSEQKDWLGYFQIEERHLKTHVTQIYDFLWHGYADYVRALKQYKSNEISIIELFKQFDQYRILLAMRYFNLGLSAINQMISQRIQDTFQHKQYSEWFFGRAVMMGYNDYQSGLSNGDIGLCVKVNQQDRNDPNINRDGYLSESDEFMVYFPSLKRFIGVARLPQSIETAFALTIHKSQGSEFEHVAVLLDERAENLLSRELFYTAVTRAKKMVSLYASPKAITQSLNVQSQRKSGLSDQINRVL
ncbi:exodeoxyribonuclease V subunit alpha [Acinetobacter sp. c1-l78]|uniref:exodeoxyribonuclease V subunit alpha n=1 Tax=Acinetobacter sp. c1-l78 TaxID=3342803 RepID=UPI0035B81176